MVFRRRSFRRRRVPSFRRRSRRKFSRRSRMLKRSRRKQRAKSYFYGYSGSKHVHSPAGAITIATPDPQGAETNGLFAYRDTQEIFEQVRNVDDLIFPGRTTLGKKAGRINTKIRVKGQQLFQVSNGNLAGAVWLEVYICRPRKYIPNAGIGNGPNVLAPDVINNNAENAYAGDYNDARGITLGATTFPINNATSQSAPSISAANFAHTPYMVPVFTQNWKVIKQLKFMLPAGGQCMFKVSTGWKSFSREVYQPKNQGDGTNIADWAVFRPSFGREVFFRFHGQPVHDSTTDTLVNYGIGALDVVNIKKYWYSSSHRNLPSYNMGTGVGQGTITNANLPSGTTEPVKDN
ncbi:MAG: capsid protein [Cressdnaviricota sp.]|nr:MAG: capsid protein [Cressdnaviricota sp.]